MIRQIYPTGIKMLLPLRVLCLKRNKTLPRPILPQAHEHLPDRFIGANADAEPQPRARLRCPDDGTVIDVL